MVSGEIEQVLLAPLPREGELPNHKEVLMRLYETGFLVSPNLTEEEARKVALESEAVQRHLEGKPAKKLIYVPGRLVNVVV